MSTEEQWLSKKVTVQEVLQKIKPGNHIYVGNGAGAPHLFLQHLTKPEYALVDNEIIQFLPLGPTPYIDNENKQFRVNSFFVDEKLVQVSKKGFCDYTPIGLFSISQMFLEQRYRIDVALIKVTPPRDGYVSLGIAVDIARAVINRAQLVLAEVNNHMPWTHGDSLIPIEAINYWVENDHKLLTQEVWPAMTPTEEYSADVIASLGKNIALEIEDGSTLQIGIGAGCNAVLPFLNEHKNLGLHTELLTPGLVHLIREGVINNSKKILNRGKTVVSHCFGTQETYNYIHENENIEFHPISYTNNWQNIGTNDKVVAIGEAHEVDLTGQTSSDSRGFEFYGSFGGKTDFNRGAFLSKEGKSIVALFSTRNNGNESNIVPSLRTGSGVVISRADIQYIITEYGTANLRGKTIRERCLAMIDVAHPKFREQLLVAAKRYRYISINQPGVSFKHRYPSELETNYTTKDDETLLVRPVKAVDEKKVREFFHSLSDRSIYMRYFRHLRSLPHQILQNYVNIDYSQNMTLIVLDKHKGMKTIIGMGQWVVDTQEYIPDLAFQVADEWQGYGIGRYLLTRLLEIAKMREIPVVKAEVLAENRSMLHLMSSIDYPYETYKEFGVVTYVIKVTSS